MATRLFTDLELVETKVNFFRFFSVIAADKGVIFVILVTGLHYY